jgi:hypothetical protein
MAAATKGKHTDWFTDGKGYGDAPAVAQNPQAKITPDMTPQEMAAATINIMTGMGAKGYDHFDKYMRKMVPTHRMKRSIKASVLSDRPYFGSCRIGKVPLKRNVTGEAVIVTELQYYIANFNTVISTAENSKLHTPKNNDFGRTFFGVVVDVNETTGNAIGFNKNYGSEGILYQTNDEKEALMFMTAFSSGKSPKEIADMMERATQKVAQAAPAPAPGMRR